MNSSAVVVPPHWTLQGCVDQKGVTLRISFITAKEAVGELL